jgi:hypothetical protein
MQHLPEPAEIQHLLSLGGWSGAETELMEWYLHDFDPREESFASNLPQLRRINSLIQSRIFELQSR